VKITARITGTADLARLDVTRLRDRLIAALEREVQLGSPSPRLRGEGRGEGQQQVRDLTLGRPSP
jgi:hypothetical protein